MQPSEPPPPGTSLDLTADPGTATPASAPPATELVLPQSDPPPMPPVTPDPPARPAAPGPLGNLVVAHFRRVEIAMLGRVLVTTLAGALPPSMIEVEWRRSLTRRHGGNPIGVTITAGERRLSFRAPEVGVTEASIGHVVRGIVLSSTPVPVSQWLDELGAVLDHVTREDEATRLALERALLS